MVRVGCDLGQKGVCGLEIPVCEYICMCCNLQSLHVNLQKALSQLGDCLDCVAMTHYTITR